MKLLTSLVIFVVLLTFNISAISVEEDNYRIQTLKETSGWNSRGYEHIIEYEWNGLSPIERDYCMRMPVQLATSSTAEILRTKQTTLNFSVGVVPTESLSGNASGVCDQTHNDWFSWETVNGTINSTFCYDVAIEDDNVFVLANQEQESVSYFDDVTAYFNHYQLGGIHYYCVEDLTWQPDEIKTVRYRYTDNEFSNFKWDALFGNIQTQTVDLVLDPYTNSSLYVADFAADNSSFYTSIVNSTQLSSISTGYRAYNSLSSSTTQLDKVNSLNNFIDGTNSPSLRPVGKLPTNGALEFDSASSEYITAATAASWDLSGEYTIGIWFNHTSNSGTYPLLQIAGDGTNNANGNGLKVYLNNGKISALFNEGDAVCELYLQSTGTYSLGQYHLVVVELNFTGNNMTVWVDGSVVGSHSDNDCAGTFTTTNPTYIGKMESGSYFDGGLDEFFVLEGNNYDIAELWNSGVGKYYPEAETYRSANLSTPINVSTFSVSWYGNRSSIELSFDGGDNYQTVFVNTSSWWPYAIRDVMQFLVPLADGEVISNLQIVVSDTFVSANETNARQAILAGVADVLQIYQRYSDQQLFVHKSNGSNYNGTFDIFISSGNKRWAFNYDQSDPSALPLMQNVTPVFYVWQAANLTTSIIREEVIDLIEATA